MSALQGVEPWFQEVSATTSVCSLQEYTANLHAAQQQIKALDKDAAEKHKVGPQLPNASSLTPAHSRPSQSA